MDAAPSRISAIQAIFLILFAAVINLAVLYIWADLLPLVKEKAQENGSNRYQFINTSPMSAFRLDRETGEVLFFLIDQQQGRMKVFRTSGNANVDYHALGINPETHRVADWARYNRALREIGLEPSAFTPK